jgi:hypothetical protein
MYRSSRFTARHSQVRECATLRFFLFAAVTGSFLLLLTWPLASQAAQPGPALAPGIATILQGQATVIRGLSQFDAIEGMRLQADDIVKTDKASFLRVEYKDQSWLELGPETELQLRPLNSQRGKRPGLYLMRGWLKLGGQPGLETGQGISLPGADLTELSGVLVVHLDDQSRAVFAEKGTGRWVDRTPRGTGASALNSGDFLTAGANNAPKIESRPTPQFVELLPRPYRDTLPARYSLYADKNVTPKEQRGFSYAEVESWLNAEATERRQFIVTWRSKARDAQFRNSLDEQMPMHPEWDRLLHPEKYEPPAEAGTPPPNPSVMSSAPPTSTPR